MKVVESRFLRGPNVHGTTPRFVSLLDLADHEPIALDELGGAAGPLRTLMPGGAAPAVIGAQEVAALLARLMLAAQAWAGSPATSCDAFSLATGARGQHRVGCGYRHEAVVEGALRLSIDLMTALLAQQAFDLDARLAALRSLVDVRAIGAASQALLDAARARGIPVLQLEDHGRRFALGWGPHRKHYEATPPHSHPHVDDDDLPSLDTIFPPTHDGRIPVVAVTGTNGKTTTTRLIAHLVRACGARTGTTTTQGIYIDAACVETGDCSGYWSARRVLGDPRVEVATLETARGGILKRGLAFDRCDVGVVLNVSADHLGLDGVETLQDLAHVKGLIARCARDAAVLNADDAFCVAMRETLAPGCEAVFFTMDPRHPVFVAHLKTGGAGACLDADGWLVWCRGGERSKVVEAAKLAFTLQGHARHNTANALAAIAALCCLGHPLAPIAAALATFVSDARSNPLRANQFEVDGVKLIVDYAHNVVACRALCEMARSMLQGTGRLLGVVTSPGDRRRVDLYETGRVCGDGFDELVVYEQDPRGREAGAITRAILDGARGAAPGKPLHGEPQIRRALALGLAAARAGDVVVFTCAGTFDDLVEGVRLGSPVAAERIAREVAA